MKILKNFRNSTAKLSMKKSLIKCLRMWSNNKRQKKGKFKKNPMIKQKQGQFKLGLNPKNNKMLLKFQIMTGMVMLICHQRKAVNQSLILQTIHIIKTRRWEEIAILNKNLIEISTSSNKKSDTKFELNEKSKVKIKKRNENSDYYKKGSKW